MICEKCHAGEMVPTKVRRLSGCVVALGFCLLILSIGALLIAILTAIIGVGGSGALSAVTWESARTNAVHELSVTPGVPSSFVDFFATNQIDASDKVAGLPSEAQTPVRRILENYNVIRGGTALGTGGVAVLSGAFVLITFVVCIPVLIVGFLLVLKKKVWRCPSCGFIFDRA